MPTKLIIILPDDHPQSPAYLSQIKCEDCRSKAEELAKHGPLLCPYCMGTLPTNARFCAWCTQKITLMQN